MAIVNCSECNKEVSDKAATCPHCGNPMYSQPEAIEIHPDDRMCFKCNYKGPMKTWLRNYNPPQFIALVLLMFYVIPGIIFIAWGWGKYKCPQCGTIDNNAPISTHI